MIVTGDEVEIRYVVPTSQSSEHIRFCYLRLDYFLGGSGSGKTRLIQPLMAEPVLNKLGLLVADPQVRGLLGQREHCLKK